MSFSRPEPETGQPKRKNWLDIGLIVLAILIYLLFLTGDYFLPVKSPLWLIAALLLLVAGIGLKLAQRYGISLTNFTGWLTTNWPVLILGLALLGGGLLRYQALQTRPNTPATPSPTAVQAFATEARTIINSSNWQPKSYEQPPLYLFLGASLVELSFFQQASAGKIATPEEVSNQTILDFLSYVNLILGLVTIIIVYKAASRWWQSHTAGAIAAGLLSLSWLAYQSTPNPAPQLLAAALAAGSFYTMTFITSQAKWPLFWAGLLVGLATGAAYGAILLLVPLLGIALSQAEKGRRAKAVGLSLGGWLVGWTAACPGWLLSLNRFVEGLTVTKAAPANALNSYFKEAFSYDLGLLAVLFVTLVVFSLRRTGWLKLWPVLAFPLLYGIALNFSSPVNLTRLALVTPWLALAGAGPLTWLIEWLQARLPGRWKQAEWTGALLTLAVLAVIFLVSVLGRRLVLAG